MQVEAAETAEEEVLVAEEVAEAEVMAATEPTATATKTVDATHANRPAVDTPPTVTEANEENAVPIFMPSDLPSPDLPTSELSDNLQELFDQATGQDKLYIGELLKVRNLLHKSFSEKPSSIHSPDAIRFYKEILDAPESVIRILEKGYTPQFSKDPPQSYYERNNLSARTRPDFVR